MCPSVRVFHRLQAHARAVTHTRPLPTFRFDVVCADDGGGSEDEREAGGAEGGADEGKKGKGRSRCVSAPCLVAACVACAACAVACSRCGRRLKWLVSCHRLLPGCAWIAPLPLSSRSQQCANKTHLLTTFLALQQGPAQLDAGETHQGGPRPGKTLERVPRPFVCMCVCARACVCAYLI